MAEKRHNNLIDIIRQELTKCPNYENKTIPNITYYNHNKTRAIGEIDLLCICKKQKCVYEMKSYNSNKNFSKAKSQLKKHSKNFFRFGEVVDYFYAYWSGKDDYVVKKIEVKK